MPPIVAFARRPPRRRAAALRLRAARRRFERSTLALRRAALDHADRQAEIGAVLQAALARLCAREAGPA